MLRIATEAGTSWDKLVGFQMVSPHESEFMFLLQQCHDIPAAASYKMKSNDFIAVFKDSMQSLAKRYGLDASVVQL